MREFNLAHEKEARYREAADPLAHFHERFHRPRDERGEPLVYLCGNSLGLQPVTVHDAIDRELARWAEQAVEGHFDGALPWFSYHEAASPGLARLTGGKPSEVVAMNSLTANLHLMLASFYRPRGARTRILIEGGAFPSDLYAVQSVLRHHDVDPREGLVQVRPREGEDTLRPEDVLAAIAREGERLALVLFPGVHYYTGQAFDIAAISRAAHDAGALAGFDLAHAIGNLELSLHDDGADFAVWCSYKYLNAGPGAVGGCFVHECHHERDLPRLAGWWGHDPATRFQMDRETEFHPQRGAAGWQLSNPPVLALAPLLASLAIFDEAGIAALRARGLALGEALLGWLDELHPTRVQPITPRVRHERGNQISLRVQDAPRALFEALRAGGVVCDFRPPDVIRVAPAPLYNGFVDVWRFVQVLEGVL